MRSLDLNMSGEWLAALPSAAGTYALILKAGPPSAVALGRLGELIVRPGYYAYVGSALGPGGLRARLQHHLSAAHAAHWHIDYLRRWAQIGEIWYTIDSSRREHSWAAMLAALPGASIPLRRFGASDCTCAAHLFRFESTPSLVLFRSSAAPARVDSVRAEWVRSRTSIAQQEDAARTPLDIGG
jgi:Uri superfamily endonuclease